MGQRHRNPSPPSLPLERGGAHFLRFTSFSLLILHVSEFTHKKASKKAIHEYCPRSGKDQPAKYEKTHLSSL